MFSDRIRGIVLCSKMIIITIIYKSRNYLGINLGINKRLVSDSLIKLLQPPLSGTVNTTFPRRCVHDGRLRNWLSSIRSKCRYHLHLYSKILSSALTDTEQNLSSFSRPSKVYPALKLHFQCLS